MSSAKDNPLSLISDQAFKSEIARRTSAMRKTHGAPPKVLAACPRCGKVLGARERRLSCAKH